MKSGSADVRWSVILVYLSLGFLGIWLVRSGYLHMPVVQDSVALALSLLLVVIGFLASALAWWQLLRAYSYPVPFRLALSSTGLTIFGKYMPGKLWIIIARAGYIAEHSVHPISAVAALSVTGQILAVWLGLLLGACIFLASPVPPVIVGATLGMWLALSAVLLSDVVHRSARAVAGRLKLRLPSLPRMRLRHLLALLPAYMLAWICWVAGFSLFASALIGTPPSIAHGLAFALAATLGILAVFAPGGLGVREGVLVGLLMVLGTPAADSTTISVQSRIWFLAGEGSIFLLGLLARSPREPAE